MDAGDVGISSVLTATRIWGCTQDFLFALIFQCLVMDVRLWWFEVNNFLYLDSLLCRDGEPYLPETPGHG